MLSSLACTLCAWNPPDSDTAKSGKPPARKQGFKDPKTAPPALATPCAKAPARTRKAKPETWGEFTLGQAVEPSPTETGPEPVEEEILEDPPSAPPPQQPRPTPGREVGSAPKGADPTPEDADVPPNLLEMMAAVHRVAGLPSPFTDALVSLPKDGLHLEVADALVLVQHPRPFKVTLTFQKLGLAEKVATFNALPGFTQITPPKGYEGGMVRVQCERPLIAYHISTAEQMLWNIDRQTYARRFLAPKDSRRRAQIVQVSGLREEILPKDPKEISEHPVFSRAWKAFIETASKIRM